MLSLVGCTRVAGMAAELRIDTTEHKARELLNNRIDAVRALVTSRQCVTDAQQALKEAEDDDVSTYNAALKAGWTAEELRKLNLPEPAKKTRTRRRPPQRRTANSSTSTPEAEASSSNEATVDS